MISVVLLSVLLPIAAAVGVLTFMWMIPPVRSRSALSGSAFGIALGVGLFISFFFEAGFPEFPPRTSEGWIGWLAIVIVPISFLFALTSRREFPWLETCSLLLGLLVALVPVFAGVERANGELKPLFPGMGVAAHGALAFMIAFGIVAIGRLQETRHGAILPTAFGLSFLGSAACALASGWISMTILFGVLAAIAGICAILTRFSGLPAIGRGGAVAVVLVLVILPMATWHKTTAPEELHWWYWLLLAGSPLLLLPCENRFFSRLPANGAYWLRAVIVAIPIVFVLIRIMPMLVGQDAGGDDMDDMMKMYQ